MGESLVLPFSVCVTNDMDYPALRIGTYAMATRFEILLPGDDESRLRAAGQEAIAEIERLDAQLSLYSPDSDISMINAHAAKSPVKVDPRLFRLLQRCAEISALTGGAFDVTIAPLMRAWGFTGDEGRTPDAAELADAMSVVGMGHVILNCTEFTVSFDREGAMLDLGAVGKGYAIDRAADILRECGVTSALLHGGTSSIHGLGVQPDGAAWRIAIKHPFSTDEHLDVVDLRDSSLSVSAVHGKSFVVDGIEYGHVIDPRTGSPTKGASAAVIVGASATDCDALSTALLVLGEPGIAMLDGAFPDFGCMAALKAVTSQSAAWEAMSHA